MKRVGFTFNGTGAANFLSLGFIPDEVLIRAVEDADGAWAEWSKGCRAAESDNGFSIDGSNDDVDIALYTAGAGVEPYEGGDALTATEQTSVAYGEGVYLHPDPIRDYSKNDTYGVATADGALNKWTLDTSANRTGHFNDDVPASVARIGEGSLIRIEEDAGHKQKTVVIEALTAGQGVSADEVTLARAVKTGKILSISGMYDMIPYPLGSVTGQGIKLNATTLVNVDAEINLVIATLWDN